MPASGAGGRSAGPRRAEVLASLSIAIDLGLGLPAEHVLGSARIAALLADRLDLDEPAAGVRLLHQPGALDRLSCRLPRVQQVVRRRPRDAARQLRPRLGRAALPALPGTPYRLRPSRRYERARLLLTLLATPRTRMAALIHSHCLSAGLMAEHIGLDTCVRDAVAELLRALGRVGAAGRADGSPSSRCRPGWSSWRRPSRCTCAGTASRARSPWRAAEAGPSSTRSWWRSSRAVVPSWPAWPRATRGRRRWLSRRTGTSCSTTPRPTRSCRRWATSSTSSAPSRSATHAPWPSWPGRQPARLGLPGPDVTRRTTRRLRARPRADGRAELGLGEGRKPHRVRPGADPALPLPHRSHPEPGHRARGRLLDRRAAPRTPRRVRLPPRDRRLRACR